MNLRAFITIMLLCMFTFSLFGQTYFSSDPAGNLYEIISAEEMETMLYSAELDIDGDMQIIRLFRENEQYAKVEKTVKSGGFNETMYQDECRIYKRDYTGGQLISEVFYNDNLISEKRTYSYNNEGYPESVEALDINNEFLYTDKFFYHSGGRLLQVRRTWNDDSFEMISYSYDKSGMLIRIFEHYSDVSTMKLYSDNKFISETNWENDQLKSDNVWSYSAFGSTYVEKDIQTGKEKKYEYDQEGRIVKTVDKVDVFLKITDYTYLKGSLDRMTARSPGLLEEWIYTYDNDNKTKTIDYFRNGEITKKTEYIDDDTMTEKLYKDGNAFLKITFVQGARVKQEYLE